MNFRYRLKPRPKPRLRLRPASARTLVLITLLVEQPKVGLHLESNIKCSKRKATTTRRRENRKRVLNRDTFRLTFWIKYYWNTKVNTNQLKKNLIQKIKKIAGPKPLLLPGLTQRLQIPVKGQMLQLDGGTCVEYFSKRWSGKFVSGIRALDPQNTRRIPTSLVVSECATLFIEFSECIFWFKLRK